MIFISEFTADYKKFISGNLMISYLCIMTIEEFKAYFETVSLPTEAQITIDMHIFDVPKFIQSNIAALERWTKDLDKCPSYSRLLNFKIFLDNNL